MALWEVLFTDWAWFQDAESAEVMVTVPVRGGASAGSLFMKLLSHVQRVMDQLGH
jgi:hypothetical protein